MFLLEDEKKKEKKEFKEFYLLWTTMLPLLMSVIPNVLDGPPMPLATKEIYISSVPVD